MYSLCYSFFFCIVTYRFTDTNAKIINMLPCSLPLFHKKSNLMLCHVWCSLPHCLSLMSMLFLTLLHLKHFLVQPNWTIPCFLNIALTPHQSSFIPVSTNFPQTHISKFHHLSSPVSDVTFFIEWAKVFSLSFPCILQKCLHFLIVHI